MTPNTSKNAMLRNRHLIVGKSDATRGLNYSDVKLSEQMQHKIAIMNKLSNITLFEKLWYAFFTLAGVLCLIFIKPFNFQLVFAVVSLYIYMISNNLTANGNKLGMMVMIFSAVMYSINCFFYRIYGEIIVNAFVYIPIYIFTFVSFYRNTNKENSKDEFLEVKKMKVVYLLLCLLIFVVGSAGVYFGLKSINSAFPLINALSVVSFMIGMIVRIFRYIEFWLFDLLGNIFNVLLWLLASITELSSLPFVLSSISSAMLGFYGFFIWKKLYRKSQATRGVLLVKRKLKVSKIIKLRRRYKSFIFSQEINSNNKIG